MNILTDLKEWAKSRYKAEVDNRPYENIHRQTLKETWGQIIKKIDEMIKSSQQSQFSRPDPARELRESEQAMIDKASSWNPPSGK